MEETRLHRRGMLAAAAGLALAALAGPALAAAAANPVAHPTPKTSRPVKIGVVGSGRIGSILGELWLRAGHQVMFSDRDPAVVKALTDRLPGARGGTPREAAAFGEVVLISVPYGAMPDISRDLASALRGKVVIDTGNPNPGRDGEVGVRGKAKGAGLSTAEYLPGAKVVRAFNAISYLEIGRQSHRPGQKAAIAIGADDAGALALGDRLVREAGFEPVNVGDLAATKRFDQGTGVGGTVSAAELRKQLGL